jgi:hypothetical protein
MEYDANEDRTDTFVARRFTEWERGILLGAAIGAFLGPSICLLVIVLLFGYDLYGPTLVYKIIERLNNSEKSEESSKSSSVEEIEDEKVSDKFLEDSSASKKVRHVPLRAPSARNPAVRKSAPPAPPPDNGSSANNFGIPFNIPMPNFRISVR